MSCCARSTQTASAAGSGVGGQAAGAELARTAIHSDAVPGRMIFIPVTPSSGRISHFCVIGVGTTDSMLRMARLTSVRCGVPNRR